MMGLGMGPARGSSQSHFASVPQADIPRSVFDRSHNFKTTFNSDYIVPFFVDEVLPGDTFSCRVTSFARMATPIQPLLDNLYCDMFFFFVPNRLLWTNWKKFNGEQANPADSTSFVVPTITSTAVTGYLVNSIHDYMGIPIGVPGLVHIALFHRAYNLIWNEWFRDENLQNSVTINTGDGPDAPTDYALLKRGKRHDYFTSALPWTQKATAVSIPLGTTAPVVRTSNATSWQVYNTATNTLNGAGTPITSGAGGFIYIGGTGVSLDPVGGLYTDLSAATAATINSLRQAFQIQRLYERDARGGTRYTEIVRAHFGVTSPDARLQRPEYLGGGSTSVNISPVPQTSSTDAVTPQGNLSGMGTFSHSGIGFTRSFTEHGVLLGLMNVRADLNYQQGLNRMWSRSTRFDFYWPALSHLGEQAILNKEIYAQGSAAPTVDAAAFGYQERYAEYRYKPSLITGHFRSTSTLPLDSWHLAQKFTALPVLNSTFISETVPMSRVLAIPTADQFLFDASIQLRCARPMPTYSVPGMIDHF